MRKKRPTTIDEYIAAAPAEGRPHLRRLREILKSVAPEADEAIKWGAPFFVEPRFLFSFSAHKAHLSYVVLETEMKQFAKELAKHRTTKVLLQVGYDEKLPEALIRKLAKHQLKRVKARADDAFW